MSSDRPSRPEHELDELLGAYVLDAVDDDERADVEAHLAQHPEARREVERLRAGLDLVVEAEATAPPAHLWSRLEERLGHTAEVGAPTTLDAVRARRGRPARVLAAAAAAIVVLAIGVVAGRATTDGSADDLASSLRAAASRAAAQPDAHRATLSGSGGEVRVVVDATGLAYVDSSLATLGADRAYQLWTLDSGTPVSLGLLGRTPGMVVVNVGSARSLAITAEPAAGSVRPTANPVAAGEIS